MSVGRVSVGRVMPELGAIYEGDVVHVRRRPRHHRLSYRVFMLALDVDRLGELDRFGRLLTHNRPGLLAICDRDHGPGDGTAIAQSVRTALQAAGLDHAGHRIVMLTMPRVAGYVFNPLTVFYGFSVDGVLAAVVYEVNNTFGERHCYAVPAGSARDGVYGQQAAKALYVSPFTPADLRYRFSLTAPLDRVTVGVQLHDAAGGLMRTHFAGERRALTAMPLLRATLRYPLLTLKVIAGIHWEAAKLYLKGIPLFRHHPAPRYTIGAAPSQKSLTHVQRATG